MTPGASKSTGTRAQTMSKEKAVDGIAEATRELHEARHRQEQARDTLAKAESDITKAEDRLATFHGHLSRAIEREIG